MTTLAAAARWDEALASLWADERKAAAEFLQALAEFDEKRVWEVLGYSGLFRYLTGALGMSEALAYYRKEGARLVRWCPAALEALREGRLCLTSLAEVSKVLTPENWEEVLLHRIHFTASVKFVQKLQQAKDALAHRVDSNQLEAVLDAALEALLEKEAKRPKTGIAQAAKRQVQERDEGQCQWPLLQGGVCGEKRFLQLDHVIPKARGGDGAADNLRLLCAKHNREAAKQAFGEAWVARFGRPG